MKSMIALVATIAVPVCLLSLTRADAQENFDAQDIVDRLVAIQPTNACDQLGAAGRGEAIRSKFDANRYFTVLNRLQPDDGLVLDWVFWNGGIGGHPVLYLREQDAPPFAGVEALEKSTPQDRGNRPSNRLERIRAEDSPEGFFQLVALHLLGDRFCLFWHEYYNEIALVCSPAGWQAILRREQNRGGPYTPPPPDFIASAEKLDFAPHVQMDPNQVMVDVVAYCPFGGLERRHFEIARPFPHRILTASRTNLLHHSQRFVF